VEFSLKSGGWSRKTRNAEQETQGPGEVKKKHFTPVNYALHFKGQAG
jgi:hypothetical protein